MRNNGDSKYQDLNLNLNAIGKAVFVRFYYDFKDTSIHNDVLAEKLLKENPNSYSKRQGFRIPRARHIFELGQQLNALRLIIDSERVDSLARDRARTILLNEEKIDCVNNDLDIEHEFINNLNKSIVYSEIKPLEYNNTPQKPKEKIQIKSLTYNRDKIVAQNALAKANYLCEVDNKHILFLRKNSLMNYTEPHHIVPLSAQVDFPTINLDREQNIVSLCSHCHNLLHYGKNYEQVLETLYYNRKELLEKIGIKITFEDLLKYYT